MKKKRVIISIIITIILDLLFIPIRGYGKFSSLYAKDNIINIVKQNSCNICINYQIAYLVLIIQTIIIFIIIYLILSLFKKEK